MKITIIMLTDTSDCEDCGMSWAEGAAVSFDGEEVLRLEPHAHCFSGADYTSEQIYRAILEKLGHEVTVSGE